MPKKTTTIVPLSREITDVLDQINSGATDEAYLQRLLSGNQFAGAEPFLEQQYRQGANKVQGRDPNAQGVYAAWPASTPKYMRHRQGRPHEFFDSLARMYVRIRGKNPGQIQAKYKQILNSFADAETQDVARQLIGNGREVGGMGYIDFLLQRVDHPINEKFQVVETLSDNYVAFFFGQQAPVFSFSGTLMNTYQDDWAMRMFRLFRDIARGTQLARRGLLFYIRYDSMIVSGAMLNFNFSLNAEMEMAIPFSFQLLVKKVHLVYGGLSQPTDLSTTNAGTFLPPDYQLVETTYQNIRPKMTKPSGEQQTGGTVPTPQGTASAPTYGPVTEQTAEAGEDTYSYTDALEDWEIELNKEFEAT